MTLQMTASLARAIGMDAGNKNMRNNGRSAWNEDDHEAATEAYLNALALVNKCRK